MDPSTASSSRRFRLLNVFVDGDDPFSGNPLCVFEDGSGLSDGHMQRLARQFNLSETTFVRRVAERSRGEGGGAVAASVRIFTPSYELPFAGHPTLGTAHVVRELLGTGDELVLRMPAGDIPVRSSASDPNRWTLQARHPRTRPVDATAAEIGAMLGLEPAAVGEPLWVDTGVEQLIVPVASPAAVVAAYPDPALLRAHAISSAGESLVYVWAPTAAGEVAARLFFTQDAAVVEDPATGSACANLGGWLLANGHRALHRRIRQGEAVQRPSVLDLSVDEAGEIFVSGAVRQVGSGTVTV